MKFIDDGKNFVNITKVENFWYDEEYDRIVAYFESGSQTILEMNKLEFATKLQRKCVSK